jgi:hypothetical protein
MLGLFVLGLFCGSAGNVRADEPVAAAANIDLVICLDVSSSMNGLIGSAKSRLWDIVNELAKAQPTPNLRVGLYSYGHTSYDRNLGWVRKELDFTADLDKANDKLFGLTSRGGTEYVARVCNYALDELDWSKDAKALKLIFVCGNEPVNQDKQIDLKDVAAKALRQGVIINTIFCGSETHRDAAGWREFASMTEGRYAAISQKKSVVAAPAPQDKRIAELGVKLGDTYVFAGRESKALAENQTKQDVNAAKQGEATAAARAVAKANGIYRFQEDLVERVQKDTKFELKEIADADLPESLKKLPPAEREQHLKDLAQKRGAIQKEILELNREREQFLRDAARNTPTGPGGFDDALRGAIRGQAKAKGIQLKD